MFNKFIGGNKKESPQPNPNPNSNTASPISPQIKYEKVLH
jgi:hypothetical protein